MASSYIIPAERRTAFRKAAERPYGDDENTPGRRSLIALKAQIEDLVDELGNAHNGGTDVTRARLYFVDALTRQHRTLQQGIIRSLLLILGTYGEVSEEIGYDLRNEAATKACQKISAEVAQLPFI
jgi:hypothetical protein